MNAQTTLNKLMIIWSNDKFKARLSEKIVNER